MLAPGGSEPAFDWLDPIRMAEMHVAKGFLFRCERFPEGDLLFDHVIFVANRVVAAMSTLRQKPLWDAALASPCFARMTPRQQAWLRMIDRTGARDAAQIANLGATILREGWAMTAAQREFAVTATAAAQLALGDKRAAHATIEDNWDSLEKSTRDWPTLELMRRLSEPK
jgi:hypothetical protein